MERTGGSDESFLVTAGDLLPADNGADEFRVDIAFATKDAVCFFGDKLLYRFCPDSPTHLDTR